MLLAVTELFFPNSQHRLSKMCFDDLCGSHLTSKPSQPYRGAFKPDLAVFVNLDMLSTNLLSFFPAVASLSSTSASKFEFIGLSMRGCAGSILFEFKFPRYINLNVRPLKM